MLGRLNTLLIIGLALGAAQADFGVSAKANVVTPDRRPAERCAATITSSRTLTREVSWTDFRGQFAVFTMTSSYKPLYVHVRCEGWMPVVRPLGHRLGRGWSGDGIAFVPDSLRKPVNLGTITLQPSRVAAPSHDQ